MVKQRHFCLNFKKLSEIFLNLKLVDKTVPNYFFQIFSTKFEMSNEHKSPDLIESNKNEANSKDDHMKKRHKYTKEERKQDRKARLALKQEKKAVGFHDNETLKQTQYYFENDLRKVYPYFFGWNTTAKERWFVRNSNFYIDFFKSSF